MSQADTKQRILDVAEELFATGGFHATSLRMITRAAEVNLAAVHYHFGSKEALLEAVMERRLGPLNTIRQVRLDRVEQDAAMRDGVPDLRALWAAFIEPTLSLRHPESEAGHFLTLIGQALANPEGDLMQLFLKQMTAIFMRLYQLTCQALPDVPRQLLFWRVHFAVGSISHLMRCNDQAPVLPNGVTADVAVEDLTRMLLDYTLAGLEAPQWT